MEVELDPFAIDVHEVTNYQYEYCVAAGGCTEPRYGNALSDDQKSYYGDERFRDYPVVAISWEQAEAYCAFVDKRLPTEFEWERVAKGVGERLFPADALSDDIEDCKSLGFNTLWCRGDARMDAVTDTEVDFVTENGKRIYHLFGNAAEWTSTPYDADVQCSDDPPCPRKEDCAQGDLECANNAHSCPACEPPSSDECYYQCDAPGDTRWTIVCDPYDVAEQPLAGDTLESSAVGSQRVIRGGSVVLSANASTCQYRSGFRDFRRDPNAVEPFLGFRCAKSL
ncbi:MAG: hypothetical protein CSA66_06405 [Proteobacteria bacterium]|nr:MAG: hypothetical protein CSA66_06405 [Pseudomonadota bacterium]